MAIKKKATAKKATKTKKFSPKSRKVPARGGKVPARRRGPAPTSQATKRTPRAAKRPAGGDGAPVAAGQAAAAPQPDHARPTALAIAQAGLDKKAEAVTVLDVRGLTSYADYFVVMTADSDRQASAIADHVEHTMKEQGVTKVGVEGYETGRWILVDYGDVVAHVMNRDSRGFYDLEGLWADAPKFTVEG